MAMAGTHMSPQEVDEMLESKSDEIFYRQVNPISMAARLAVEDAANRHREILKLEESISELQDIFQDIFHMVDSQVRAKVAPEVTPSHSEFRIFPELDKLTAPGATRKTYTKINNNPTHAAAAKC